MKGSETRGKIIKPFLLYMFLIADEAAVLAILLLVLPAHGITLPIFILLPVVGVLVIISILSYRIIPSMFKRPLIGAEAMVGVTGQAITSIDPEGLVRISGEIWRATSQGSRIAEGEEVVVTKVEGLKLTVMKTGSS